MNVREISTLLAMVRALCPAQKIDEHTPDAWLFVLDDVPFDDARAALKTLGKQLRFIAPADIATEVRRARRVRAAAFTDYADTLPDADPDDVPAYIAALRAGNYRAASGELTHRPVLQAIETTFHHVETKWNRRAVVYREPPAIEHVPELRTDDPEFDIARGVLDARPDRQDWITKARRLLEDDGKRLATRDVVILAANLATREEGERP